MKIALTGSIAIGLLVALPGLSSRPLLRLINRSYVELFRSIPVLVMIVFAARLTPKPTGD